MNFRRSRSPRAAAAFAAAAGPALVLFLAAADFGVAPASTSAAGPDGAAEQALAPAKAPAPPTAAQLAARDHAAAVLRQPFDGAPFRFAAPSDPSLTDEESAAPAVPAPAFTVSSIINTTSGGIAVVEGKPRRTGDAIADGWIVKHIDPVALTVVVSREGDPEFTLRLRNAPPR